MHVAVWNRANPLCFKELHINIFKTFQKFPVKTFWEEQPDFLKKKKKGSLMGKDILSNSTLG